MKKRRATKSLQKRIESCDLPVLHKRKTGIPKMGSITLDPKPLYVPRMPSYHVDPHLPDSDDDNDDDECDKASSRSSVRSSKSAASTSSTVDSEEEFELELKKKLKVTEEQPSLPLAETRVQVSEKAGCPVTTVGWERDPKTKKEHILMMNTNPTEESRHPVHVLKRHVQYHVRVVNVKNPSNFYMELVLDSPRDECGCETMDECLQDFYNDPKKAEAYKMRTFVPIQGQLYAFFCEEFDKWERIRVQTINCEEQTVIALYQDHLKTNSHVPYDALHELHPRYAYWHRYPINGGLKDVVPAARVYDVEGDRDWSEEAIEYFKELVENKQFLAYFFDLQFDRWDNMFHVSDEDRFARAEVLLFEDENLRSPQIPVNVLMVERGYGIPTCVMADCMEMIDLCYGVLP